MFFIAVCVLMASFFVPGGPTGAGWTLYPPQAILPGTPGSNMGITLMLISLSLFVLIMSFIELYFKKLMALSQRSIISHQYE